MDSNVDFQKRSKRKSCSKETISSPLKAVKIIETPLSPDSLPPSLALKSPSDDVEGSTCRNNSKSKMDSGIDYFAELPDEVMLMIFKNCSKPMLVRCACVCRRWKHIALDNDLWTRIDLSQRKIASGIMIHVLCKKPIVLRMAQTEVCSPIFTNNPLCNSVLNINSKIEYLDLSMAVIKVHDLELLLRDCYSLKKLSLEHCELSETVFREISKNVKLTVLNLSLCTGINDAGLKLFLKNCRNLIELNIAWTSLNAAAIKLVCQLLPKEILKLNLSGCVKEMSDLHVSALVIRCNKLRELDLSDATGITELSINVIRENLKNLRVLSLSRCYNIYPPSYAKLFTLPFLTHLNIFGLFLESQIDQFRKMNKIYINQMKFSFIARPTVGDRRTSIWCMPSRDR